MSIEERRRIEYLDIFRGIGIILMVMGHIGFTGHFDYFIHAFHMPMFFFVAGYFFNEQVEARFFILSKIKTILIPYVSFGIM
jgi:fucose 4-O-acetylase-like acetyltransferase